MSLNQQRDVQQLSAVCAEADATDSNSETVVASGSNINNRAGSENIHTTADQRVVDTLVVIMQQLSLLAEGQAEVKRDLSVIQNELQNQLAKNQTELQNQLRATFTELDQRLNTQTQEIKEQAERTEQNVIAQIEQVRQQCQENNSKLKAELTEYVSVKIDTIQKQVELFPQVIQAQKDIQCSLAMIPEITESQDNLRKQFDEVKEKQTTVEHRMNVLAGKFSEMTLEQQNFPSETIEETVKVALQSISECSEDNFFNKGLKEVREELGEDFSRWKENIERSLNLSQEDLETPRRKNANEKNYRRLIEMSNLKQSARKFTTVPLASDVMKEKMTRVGIIQSDTCDVPIELCPVSLKKATPETALPLMMMPL
ncbi:uncharacterized protein PF11_0207-like [Schistocerca americana]|uniref:uncharacterized protein PF11_0207-like n=1 Tax=Schistocerca americana TaxID=7009 RepID=UPI001F4F25EF|nr:uncharacterized protein PF11_0207-like [Schistocerca americana]